MKRILSILVVLVFALQCFGITVLASSHPFKDVPEGAYYEEAVVWAVEKAITTGTSATTFAPKMTCDRSQAVTFLWRAAGSPEPTSAENPFGDVKADAYYYKAVLWAVEKGITSGTGNGKFSPLMKCDRSQIVTFLWRATGNERVEADNPFSDVSDTAYYAEAVLWAVEKGITTGTGGNKFSPFMICDRSQIVTFLYRAFKEPPHEHIFGEWKETSPATCTDDGINTRVCECGEMQTETIPALGHLFGDWSVSVLPTYDDEGKDVRSCNKCGITEERIIPVLIPDPFEIKIQPVSVKADIGDTATFMVETTGGKPSIGYQWQIDYGNGFEDISGAIASSYSFTVTEEYRKADAQFRCVAVDALAQRLTSDTVSINYPLWFDYEEKTLAVEPNTINTLSVDPKGGTAPYTYEWEVLYNNEWVSVSSLDRAEFGMLDGESFEVTVTGHIAEYYDTFRCKVTDSEGMTAYSPITSFTLTAMAFADDLPAEISVSATGDDVRLYTKLVSDYGTAPYTYRIEYFSDLRRKWVLLQKETTDSLIIDVTFIADFEDRDYNGRYRIIIIDDEGNTLNSETACIIFN